MCCLAEPLLVWGAGAVAPTLTAIGTYIAAGVATGAIEERKVFPNGKRDQK